MKAQEPKQQIIVQCMQENPSMPTYMEKVTEEENACSSGERDSQGPKSAQVIASNKQ